MLFLSLNPRCAGTDVMLMPLASGVQAAPVMAKMLETRRSHWGCFQALLFRERQEIPRKGQLQIEWASGTDGPARGLTDAFHIVLNVLPILNGFTKGHRIRWLRRPQKIPPAGGLDHRSAARRRAGWRCGRGGPAGSGSAEAFSRACRLQPVGWAQLADGESQQHSAVS